MPLSLFDWTHLAALAAMLLAAMWHDTATRRIPNTLVLWGSLTAIGLSLSPHGIGLGSSLAGGLVGFLGFLVFYLLRAVGAGDVKLAAATGLFVGHPDMWWVNLLVLLAGGAMALTWAICTAQLGTVVHHLQSGMRERWLKRHDVDMDTTSNPFPLSSTRLPYAVAIGLGTGLHLLHNWPVR